LEYTYFMKIGQPVLLERKSEAPRPPRQDGADTAGLPGHASGEQNVSKGSFLHIVPLDPTCKAGLAGHVPAKEVGWLFHHKPTVSSRLRNSRSLIESERNELVQSAFLPVG
jgi:hypothetical protein